MLIRPATLDDSEQLFRWRNDEGTRANCINTEPVAWCDHVRWFEKVLKVPLETLTTLAPQPRRLMVVENADGLVGTVRLDKSGSETEMSWTVAPEKRGRGLGSQMVKEAVKREAGTLVAKIKPGNHPSIRIAVKCGFVNSGAEDGLLVFRRN